MRLSRLLSCVCILSCISVPSCSLAQNLTTAKRDDPDFGVSPQALLIRSYIASQQLLPQERAVALMYLAKTAGTVEPAYSRLWSEELFYSAQQLPRDWNRLTFEKNGVQILAVTDPVRAMQLFGQLEDPIPTSSERLPEDVRAFAARVVFPAYWKVKGPEGFDDVRAQSQHLGQTGQYPYAAVAPIILDLAHSGDTRSVVILNDAVGYFSRGSRFDSANEEFVELLIGVWQVMPAPLKHQALDVAVAQLSQSTTNPDNVFHGTATSKTGTVEFTDQNKELLFQLLPYIREVDPKWADKLIEKDPSLGAPLESSNGATPQFRSGAIRNTSSASPAQVADAENRLAQYNILAQVEQEAPTDSNRALRDAQSLTDPALRSRALAEIAAVLAAGDTPRASLLLKQTDVPVEDLKNTQEKVSVLFSKAKAEYALHDRQNMQAMWTRALDLGVELFQEDLEIHPEMQAYQASCFDELMNGVKFGAKADPTMTLAALRTVQNQLLQTYLPISAAEGMHESSGKK